MTATPQTDLLDDAPLVVTSDQRAPHTDLAKIVQHHMQHPWQKPCPPHTHAAFEQLLDRHRSDPRPLILDSFCGTGMSTAVLAARYPDALVVGVDQSAHRLSKHQSTALNNYLLLRAEAEPFWYCLAAAGLNLLSHFILYPNPWPKASQLKRRVHGHGAFPVLARLGGTLEMRTNWRIFAEEFTQAAQVVGLAGSAKVFTPDTPITLFERKYQQRGHTLWRFEGKCSN